MNLAWIDGYVDGVIDYCYTNDVIEIYNTLNITIKDVDKDYSLLQGNDAMYIRDYLGTEVVFIRDDLPYQYRKFILAHELGHAILHVEIAKAAYSNKLIIKGKLERQADYFAFKLLDIKVDEVKHYGLSVGQVSSDLYVHEDSLGYILK